MRIHFKFLLLFLIVVSLSACSSNVQRKQLPHAHQQSGMASYYADKYQGRQTASGEPFNQFANTAAHKTLPFGTWVKVTNVENGRSVLVRINDRGPFVRGRIIDLSRAAFNAIGKPRAGLLRVVIHW